MPTLRTLLTGTALGLLLGLGLGPLAPATAATSATSPMAPVQGQTWSAPAYPVDCQAQQEQISCTPTDASAVVAQRCFKNVLSGGSRSTVCTLYEAHVQAIQAAGGTPLLVRYGCSLGDAVCVTFENAGRGLALAATAMMFAVAENMRFDTSSLLWTAATTEWSFWQWAVLIVLFGSMVWAIAAAVIARDHEQLVGALIRSFIAIPAVPLTLWATGHLLNAVDEMTWYILTGAGRGGLFTTLQGVMWAGGQANYFFAFLIHGLLTLGMLLLMLVFAFRNIVLAALIMIGPVAWMVFPLRGIGPQWIVRYVSAVTVLLLTGPLTIGFITLIINGLSTVKTIWDPRSWPLLVGLVLVAFAPFAIFGLFSFVGAVAADAVGSGAMSHAGRAGSSATRATLALPSRFGSLPAGTTAARKGPGPSSPAGGSGGGSRGPSRPARSGSGTSPMSTGGSTSGTAASVQTKATASMPSSNGAASQATSPASSTPPSSPAGGASGGGRS